MGFKQARHHTLPGRVKHPGTRADEFLRSGIRADVNEATVPDGDGLRRGGPRVDREHLAVDDHDGGRFFRRAGHESEASERQKGE